MLNKNIHAQGDDTYNRPRDFVAIDANTLQPVIIPDIELRVDETHPSEYLVDTNGKIISFTHEKYAQQFVGKLKRGLI